MQFVFRVPLQRTVFWLPLPVEEAQRKLAAELVAEKGKTKSLRGRLTGDKFRCSRGQGQRHGFLPVAHGRLCAEGTGTRAELWIRLPLPTNLFLLLWTLGILAVLGRGLVQGLYAQGERAWLLTVPLFAFGLGLTGVAFGTECAELERLLKQCLSGPRASA